MPRGLSEPTGTTAGALAEMDAKLSTVTDLIASGASEMIRGEIAGAATDLIEAVKEVNEVRAMMDKARVPVFRVTNEPARVESVIQGVPK